MIKKNLNILFILLTFYQIQAQSGIPNSADIKKIKTVPLLVVLESPKIEIIDELTKDKKQNELDNYYANIKNYNASIKSAFENNWDLSTEISFISNEKFQNLEKKIEENMLTF